MLTVIIPVLNESKILREKQAYYDSLKSKVSLIFVDGGSTDKTVVLARRYGEVVRAPMGRGRQKNSGAAQAEGKYFLFLHVDAWVDDQCLASACKAMDRGADAGCFLMRIDGTRLIFRLYEMLVNWRARMLGVSDGDLGFFIKRTVFEAIGGFHEAPVMEDILIGRTLKRFKKRFHARRDTIRVSARKWHTNGFIKTLSDYTSAYIQLWTGKINLYWFLMEISDIQWNFH